MKHDRVRRRERQTDAGRVDAADERIALCVRLEAIDRSLPIQPGPPRQSP
ncbi:MAG: hypothetical protein KJ072_21765 [Verrucomicrobia bacterium]|nr:hypothetical protein [Verrucomicrobiota bacterium]